MCAWLNYHNSFHTKKSMAVQLTVNLIDNPSFPEDYALVWIVLILLVSLTFHPSFGKYFQYHGLFICYHTPPGDKNIIELEEI